MKYADLRMQSNLLAGLHLLVEIGAFEKMPKEGSITSKELADLVGIDESAIGWTTSMLQEVPQHQLCSARAFRLAAMFGIGEETAPRTFAHNVKSRMYLKGGAVEFFRIW